jgi:hypothetical protein
MVERRDDPGDRRSWRLHLLPPALPVLDEMLGERDDVARLLTAGLSREVVQTVHQSLVAMKANVLGDLRSRPGDAAPAVPSPAPRRPAAGASSALQQDRV